MENKSVNKSRADSDCVSVNERGTERGRGMRGSNGFFFFFLPPQRAREDARQGADRVDETERRQRATQPRFCLLCGGHCQMSVSVLVAMFL